MLDLLQETLQYIEEQSEWLTQIQFVIGEKQKKCNTLHSKIHTWILDELNKNAESETSESVDVMSTENDIEMDIKSEPDEVVPFAETTINADLVEENMSKSKTFDSPQELATSNNASYGLSSCIGNPLSGTTLYASISNIVRSGTPIETAHVLPSEENVLEVEKFPCSSNKQQVIERHESHEFDDSENDCLIVDKVQFNEMASQNMPISCPMCKEEFTDFYELKQHVIYHHDKEMFDLKMNEEELFDHEESEAPLSCDMCSKKFKFKIRLKEHMRIHTGEKPFTCHICQKSFSLKGNMKKHIRTHFTAKAIMPAQKQ